MAEEKKTTKTAAKKSVKIKATTGAWWKSTAADGETKNDGAAEDVKTAKKTTGSKSSPKAKPTAQKKRTPKVSEKKTSQIETPQAQDNGARDSVSRENTELSDVATGGTPDPAAVAKIKTTRKSSSRGTARGRRKTAPKQTMSELAVQVPEEQGLVSDLQGTVIDKSEPPKEQASLAEAAAIVTETVSGGEDSVTQELDPDKTEATDSAPKGKRKSRPRRGRKNKGQQGEKRAEQAPAPEQEAAAADQEEVLDRDEIDDLPDSDTSDEEPLEGQKKDVKKVCKLLINAEEPEECRLALLEDGKLESIHVSTLARTQTKNNIYKARIVALEPSLQAAFVEYGREKNGFLPFSEIHPEYYKQDLTDDVKQLVEKQQWKKISITDVMEKGQEVLAQVVKEEVGKKGANMTTYLSIPGRCVVLMPGSDSSGISRKISGEEKRSELREVMHSMEMPEGIGWIVRTASVDITQNALSRDVEHLLTVWEEIKRRGQEMDGVGLVYEDHQSIQRFLREHFDPNIEEILVDDRDAMEQVKAFIDTLPSAQQDVKVRLHQGARPIFNHFSVEDQIESIYQPRVNLPSGGSIVIDPTEALVAIDVNSGSTSKGKNFEQSIFQANMEAASELARQLRLRDLGGLIVVDFIDMRNKKHVQAVERQVRQAMKRDKAKVDFTRISKFGLMQISRQKLGAPIEAGNYRRCEHCQGRGIVRSVETLSLFYLRRIQTGASRKHMVRIECHFPLDVASYLLNFKRSELREMEDRYHVEILIISEPDMRPMDNDIVYHRAEKDQTGKKQA